MKKGTRIVFLSIGFLVIVLILFYISSFVFFESSADKRECWRGGGKWGVLPTTGVDKCGWYGVGGEAFTAGCDCGHSKCWNGSQCILNSNVDERCKWKFNGLCDYLTREGYYFNEETKKCEYFGPSSGCSDPPFRTMQECKTVCES